MTMMASCHLLSCYMVSQILSLNLTLIGLKNWHLEVAVVYIQYPSDVMPPGHDTFELHEEDGMSNHPYHLPRAVAINAALEFMLTLLPNNVDQDYLMVAGHSLGAGYSFLALDWALENNWEVGLYLSA